ncbi:GGDEF domain-containing protein [Aeromicrobium wangtongii]|uniref:GGDEF domain-containing protein n=1 Tax=Aeromicrobium wangtongii TaxID=2969247 RepID=UPI0020174DEA|nr:GGDEF domain-containing protein [Aeromicrobium wangtongii]MCL3819631.1 GGDEF domain-containing protein [Aeromicrobium wangtongii]
MLDTASLRVAFGVVAVTLLVLFYFVAYRTSRSAYCGWWCVALLLFIGGSAAYVLDGTSHQVWANPLGSTLMVGGVCAVWAGTRSLRDRPVLPALFVVAPGSTLLAAVLDDPAANDWAGGGVFLAWMTSAVALASWELWSVRPAAAVLLRRERTFSPAVRTMAVMASAFSAYYAARTVAFLTSGPDGDVFERFFGSAVTTLFTTVLLATVSFGMTSLSFERETEELRTRATRDGLTGLLNRQEFMRQAAAEWRSRTRTRPGVGGCLVLADLDHFKLVNDTYGHPAGDYALQAFAATCRGVVRSTDLVGRYGGEEFILFLPGITPERAEQVVVEISTRLRQTATLNDMVLPTVSYGIAPAADSVDLPNAIERADQALYAAKALGRDRVIRSERLREEHEQA